MKLIIPSSIAEKVEPQLREIAREAEVVHIDQEGAAMEICPTQRCCCAGGCRRRRCDAS